MIVGWDIDKDVIRGRDFDFSQKFLPDGLSKIDQLDFLNNDERRLISQIHGRTYANMFGFVERFFTAKVPEVTRDHWLGDQIALAALVRFCDEELNHQDLFRRIEKMMASGMAEGYRWQYIFSGVEHPRFQALFESLTTEDKRQRINGALAPLM